MADELLQDCPHEGCGEKLGLGQDIQNIQKIIEHAKERKYREPAKDSLNVSVVHGDDGNGFFIASTFRDTILILPSTKLSATMAVVLTWMDEASDDKIISKFRELEAVLKL